LSTQDQLSKKHLDILKKEKEIKDFKILIHCFTGSHQFALKLIDLGCYISASGVVTFKNSKSLANTFLNLPNDRILVETDSPYLSPEPLRGKSNEPSHIIHTVNFFSKFKKNRLQ
jgi:TatD DNase family protein